MALNKQIHIYSVDTSAFYHENEQKIHKRLNKMYLHRKTLDKLLKKCETDEQTDNIKRHHKFTNNLIKQTKEKMYAEFKKSSGIRTLNQSSLIKKNIVSVFDSVLTRTINIQEGELNQDIIIVQTYFFEVIEDIILDGFMVGDDLYVCLTASAGQIRTKKTVFIKESILKEHQKTLMCGLTVGSINKHGGVNINKYLAYLALCNSATDVWNEFNIEKSMVVDDMETVINSLVDFIDDNTYEISRKNMDIPVTHTDGCGMVLPRISRKNMMVRLPWVKGLLGSFPYDTFIRMLNKKNPDKNHGIIKDIYGVEHDILSEGIEVIFTKSQFKMWKYYDSWEQYKRYYNKYNCTAGKCNEEDDEFSYAKINYQMLQTLTNITDKELKKIADRTKNNIIKIASDRDTMLRVFGVVKSNVNKNYFQQSLELYPELLSDIYTKEILKQIKKSLVKDGRSAKLDINGKYTFILPDLYAFCEWLFVGDKNPNGLLKDNEVFCRLFRHSPKLDCLRSPHLFREHAVRNNVIDDEKKRWFRTNALYTSCHDLISKILQFDVDGDKSLVCADETIINSAEEHMQDVVPLYYNMRKAEAELITPHSIYRGLKAAYTGGNIGLYSNDITKIFNSGNVDEDAMKAIKILCMENNFVIDYAKTLYKPDRPNHIKKFISKYTNRKTPHFFIYAKDKPSSKVEKYNDSAVNRLSKILPNKRISFTATNLGKFNYKLLMNNSNVEIDQHIVDKYNELNVKSHFLVNKNEDDDINNYAYIYQNIREQLLEENDDPVFVSDVLIQYLYGLKNSKYKNTLWECFGGIMVDNLRNNVKENTFLCEMCGKRTEKYNTKKYCEQCANAVKIAQTREIAKKSMAKLRQRRKKE